MAERRSAAPLLRHAVDSRLRHVLTRLHRVITHAEQRDVVFAEACELLITVGEYRAAWIGIADARGAVWPVAWSGAAGVDIEQLIERGVQSSATADCLRSRAALALDDSLSLPIESLRAVLTVHRRALDWTAAECQMLELIVSTVGLGCAAIKARGLQDDGLEVFDRASVGMVLMDERGRLLRANPAFGTFVGYTQEELALRGSADISHPADWLVERSSNEALRTGQRSSYRIEKRFIRKDGATVWGHLVASRVAPRPGGDGAVFAMVVDITRRREAETALERHPSPLDEPPGRDIATETRLRTVLEAAVDGIWTLDTRGMILAANRAACELVGCREADIVGTHMCEIIPTLADSDLRAGGTLLEATARHASGRFFPIEYMLASTSATEYSLIVRDLTARRRAEMALVDSEERYRVLFATSPDGIIKTQIATMTIRWANPAACRMFGYSVAEIDGMSLSNLHPEFAVELMVAGIGQLPEAGQHLAEVPCVRKDGSTIFADVNVASLVTQGKSSMLGLYRDVTATRRMVAELRTLNRAIEHSPVSVVVTDVAGVIEYVNPRAVEVSGYSADEMLGRRPSIFKSGIHDDDFYGAMWRRISDGHEWHGELCNRRKSGELFWESGSIAPVRNHEGAITHFVAIKLDITERKRINVELLQAKEAAEAANLAKSTFLANMSHEIRTPLNAILGFSQLLIAQPGHPAENLKGLETINRSGEHLLALINDVLEMSKIEAGRTSLNVVEFDVHRLLDDIAVMFRVRTDASDLELVQTVDARVPRRICLDQGKLRQILINLVGNALKFTERGRISIRADADDAMLVVEVEDTGCGIDASDLPRLFGYFEQTAQGRASGTGTGLGLAISREFCRLMGGSIEVRSEPHRGSTFFVRLPYEVRHDSAQEGPTELLSSVGGPPNLRVLVVDDVEDNRRVLVDMLAMTVSALAEASNGREALEIFDDFAPDLVLLDMRMPVMDGYETARQMRARAADRGVRILAVSASAFEEDRQPMLDAGADECLPKPVRLADLMEAIGRLCNCEVATALAASPMRGRMPAVESIRSLDEELRGQLLDAVVRADSERLREIIAALRPTETASARALEWLVDRYDYDRLLSLLE